MRKSAISRVFVVAQISLAASIGLVAPLLALSDVSGARGSRGAPRTPRIVVISSRADLVSGGEALVALKLNTHSQARRMRVRLNGHDVTSEFAQRQNGLYEALLTGLTVGRNRLVARLGHGRSSSTVLISHAVGGPLLAGPQVKPWVCKNRSTDPQCDARTTYSYEYMSSVTHQLSAYDPKSPPPDVAMTTTQTGATVPFIVRLETGYEDRDQYQIAFLYRPGKPWSAWSPQPQFNHKLLITHGASCAINHESGTAPSTTGDTVGVPGGPGASSSPTTALGLGFAVMSTALDNAGHNCNLVTQAESLMMAKEHLIAHYGTLRYTIGTGCSGGSLTQQQVANAYPGIYQGILPQCSFPDAWSTGQQLADYHLTRGYFENPQKWGTGVVWTPDQIADVEGHPNHGNAIIFDTVYWEALADPSGGSTNGGIDASTGCAGVTSSQEYNAKSNPGGARCTLADYMINVFGPRPPSVWSANERKLGHGFAGLPIDNVGVQYGLDALKQGVITPAQFVDVNAKIGGADIDLKPTVARAAATQPALRNDYRSGAVNETNNLTATAIIDLRGPDPGAFHDAYRSWTIRARLEHQEGQFPKNHVIWFGQTPLIGDPSYTVQGLIAMDRWLSAVEADHRRISLRDKVAGDRPTDVHDRCANAQGVEQVSLPGVGPVCELSTAQTRFATPRIEAGEGIATDVEKCRLEPLRRTDYYPITFTDDEWTKLKKAFPSGVCDWTDGGIAQRRTIPWLTYQSDAHGRDVIYGGRRLGHAAPSSGTGWTSASFDNWLRPPR